MKFVLIILFNLLISVSIKSQTLFRYEKIWALTHPLAALKVNQINKKCFKIYYQNNTQNKLDTFSNGGKLDAFRHTFFMAAFAQKIKVKKIKKLGIAHEKTNYNQFLKNELENGELPDSISKIMDLKNNDLGFEIGRTNKKISLTELSQLIITAINKGEALIIKRNKLGSYTYCDESLIILTKQKKWNVGKCLIKSNN